MRDVEKLADALRKHLHYGDKVTGVTALSGGHSNETYLVQGLDKILRMPPSADPLLERALNIRRQFDLFAILQGHPEAPPLPRLEYFCSDAAVLGAPFFLMERVDGAAGVHWHAADWLQAASPEMRADISRQYIEILIRLKKVGPLDTVGPVRNVADELGRWRWTVRDLNLPDLMKLFDKLEKSAPEPYAPILVHGDCIFANMMWKDGKLAAVLDWELAYNGDPRWDLGYVINQYRGPGTDGVPGLDLQGLWQRDEMIRTWEQGLGLKADGLLWFQSAGCAKGAAILNYGAHLWATGRSTDERFAQWKMNAEFAQRTAEKLLGIFLGANA